MKRLIAYITLVFLSVNFGYSQYISEVLEYVPAPSQYMNAEPWGTPSSAQSIIGTVTGHVSLGSFGGYIVFRFDGPVENHTDNPYGIDFTIFGNPLSNWSEPGVVSVMKDENQNGEPDDAWYELAGSDHFFSSTKQDYMVTYFNPDADTAVDVVWTDNNDQNGVIEANSFYSQPYYPDQELYPTIPADQYTLQGTRIISTVDTSFDEGVFSYRRGFGYADNSGRGSAPHTIPDNPYTLEVENSGGDAFDISWAIDSNGAYVDLDQVDFIRVQSAVQDGAGWLGQVSTEITGAVDVSPDQTIAGRDLMVVVKEMPYVLDRTEFQLEPFVFRQGRIDPGWEIDWSSNLEGAVVDENNVLHVDGSGSLTLKAALSTDEQIYTTVSTTVDLTSGVFIKRQRSLEIYPNPAAEYISLGQVEIREVSIFDLGGREVDVPIIGKGTNVIDVSHLTPGIYMITARIEGECITGKFIKQ